MPLFPSIFGSLNLTTVKLSGVGESFQKHADAESKGIKAHFNMDESGVLLLDRVSSSTVNGSEGQNDPEPDPGGVAHWKRSHGSSVNVC